MERALTSAYLDERHVHGDELLQIPDPFLLRGQLGHGNVQNLRHEIRLQRVCKMGYFMTKQCEFPHRGQSLPRCLGIF